MSDLLSDWDYVTGTPPRNPERPTLRATDIVRFMRALLALQKKVAELAALLKEDE